MAQVSYGTITITDTTDIERIYVEYCRSTSNQLSDGTVPGITVAWSENTPPWVNGQYIWQRSVVKKSGSTDLTYGTPVCLTGAAGATGAAGQSLTATKTEYTIAANNVTINLSNHTSYTWTTNTPDYDASKPAYWGRITNTYTNPSKTEYLFYKDEALTKAVADAAIANSIAQQTIEDAQGALSIATGINQHFFSIPNDYSASVPAGSYITEINVDTFKQSPSGGNLLTRSDGVWLRNGADILASLQGTGLTFLIPTGTYKGRKSLEILGGTTPALKLYDAQNNNAVATLDSNGLVLSRGGITVNTVGSNNGVYISSENLGSKVASLVNDDNKTNWRAVIGSKFGVDSEGNLYANEAHINGAITATSLTIGSNATISDTSGLIRNDAVEVGGRNLLLGSLSIGTALTTPGWIPNGIATTVEKEYKDGEECIHFYGSFTGLSNPSIVSATHVNLEWGETYIMSADIMYDKEIMSQATTPLHFHCGSIASRNIYDNSINGKGGGVSLDYTNYSPEAYTVIPANTWMHYEKTFKTNATAPNVSYPYPVLRPFLYGDNRTVDESATVNGWMKNFKIERGTKATDWTPALEDVVSDIDDASKIATNYLKFEPNKGLMVADQTGGIQTIDTTTQRNVLIDSDSVDIRNGQNILAKFGTYTAIENETEINKNGVQIGKFTDSHIDIDYHSMQLVDSENNVYFHVSDLRDAEGKATLTESFLGNGSTRRFILTYNIYSVVSVTVDDVILDASDYSVQAYDKAIVLASAPQEEEKILIEYISRSPFIKAYTAGIRASGKSIGSMSFAEGSYTEASGHKSHSEGSGTHARGEISHAEGNNTYAIGMISHAEGRGTYANGDYSHAEGDGTTANGEGAHAEGTYCESLGSGTHAEGSGSIAGDGAIAAHAEGYTTLADNDFTHAENYMTTAKGVASHAQNSGTYAKSHDQTVLGSYNIIDTTTTTKHASGAGNGYSEYAIILGNGTDEDHRSNALTVDWGGSVVAAGNITSAISACGAIGTADMALSTSEKKITLSTNRGKAGAYLSNSDGGVKCGKDGYVEISGGIYFLSGFTANDIVHSIVKKNSTNIINAAHRMPANYDFYSIPPLVFAVSANDILYLYAYNQTEARGAVNAANASWLTVKYL